MKALCTSVLLLAAVACGGCLQDMDPSPGNDAGQTGSDGGAAANDAAINTPDAGEFLQDAAPFQDANPCDYDGGIYDGGLYDGGMRDAGPCDNDAGTPIDAGGIDALSM